MWQKKKKYMATEDQSNLGHGKWKQNLLWSLNSMSSIEAVKRRIQAIPSPGEGSSSVERNIPRGKLKNIQHRQSGSWDLNSQKSLRRCLSLFIWVSLPRSNAQVLEIKLVLKDLVGSVSNFFLLQKQSNKKSFSPEGTMQQIRKGF